VDLGQFIDPLAREQHGHGPEAANGLCYLFPSTWHAKRLNFHQKIVPLRLVILFDAIVPALSQEDLVKFAIPVILTRPNEEIARAGRLRRARGLAVLISLILANGDLSSSYGASDPCRR
jgi:hypothetical protein